MAAGLVFGISIIEVIPPETAAPLSEFIVPFFSKPGSLK